jgi:hypothetical protein
MLGRTITGMKVRIATPQSVKAIGEKPIEGARIPLSRMLRVPLLDVRIEALGADLTNSGKIHLDSRSVPLRKSNEKTTILCEKGQFDYFMRQPGTRFARPFPKITR